ncbi:MAG: MurR/RpiR family transcriptional regulator, partial [Tetragenococcus halophilus]|nr:MurR/RpiR family transcriptional regulator [Tetragenococcus halophilus]
MNILFTMQHHLNKLSKAERKLAEWILEQPEKVIYMSAKALSQASNTSPATVVRLCYSLGLEGFTDLKLKLSANQTTIEEDLYTDIVPNEDIDTIKQKLL